MRVAAAALLAFVSLAGGTAAQAPFDVEAVMSYSFASGLVGSPSGERIAWIENVEGERNVWVAEHPEWNGSPITSFRGDDGQEVSSLSFSADDDHVYFVRGGAPNRAGEVPDPRFTPEQEGRAVWRVPVAGGAPEEVAQAGSFTLSPDGTAVVWGAGRDIMLLELADGAEPSRLARIRGGAGSFRWAPDGGRIAFVSARGDHAFVGIVERSDGTVRYLDPSVANDSNPAWSPDGSEIAFLRVPNERVVHMFAPRREALPFSIRVVEVGSGSAREIFRARNGVGSVFSGVTASNQLLWGADDRIVFPWEGDGWKHLYSVPAAGGEAQRITPGEGEVQHASMSADRTAVLFDSNADDIERKHAWRVPVGGGAAELLTPGTGVEWNPIQLAEGAVAYQASTWSDPAHTEVVVDGRRIRASPEVPASFPRARMVEPEAIHFTAADGMSIPGQLFVPPDLQPGQRRPAVLFFHGGSRRQMLLGFHHRGYYHGSFAMNQLLANAGYVVLSVNYRSGIGYGMEFREALEYGATGASEFNDVVGAGLYLQSRDDVDPERIGLWGGSYGGYLTALGLARASHLFKAGVDIHGVHDWNVVINGFRPSYEPEDYPEFAELAYASSPMAFLDGWRSPVLLIHGDDDRNVPFSETVDLAESLSRRGVEYEQLVFPDEVHGFLLHENWVRAFEATLSFFDRKLTRPVS
ncbi:MAG: prolyl oligopeptidase family serine peptidase [Gemmatimonadota bacterium]